MRKLFLSKLPSRSYLLMVAMLAAWSLLVVFFLYQALHWPYIGAQFESDIAGKSAHVTLVRPNSPAAKAGVTVGDRYVAIENSAGERYEMTGLEAIDGRFQLHSYTMVNGFYAAQKAAWEFVKQGQFTLITAEGKKANITTTQSRPFSTLPSRTFNSMAQSLVIIAISVGIFAFAKHSLPVFLLVFSGLGLGVDAMFGILAGAREFVKPDEIVWGMEFFSGVGSHTFIYSMLVLFWHFPNPISRFPFGKFIFILSLFILSAQTFHFYEFPIHPFQIPNVIPLPLAFIISLVQWHRTRGKPLERASVMWFILTILGIAGIVVLLYSLPIALKMAPLIPPTLASFTLTLIYIGVALGTLRYRLFDMHRIWWRAIVWLVGGLVVMASDLLLVSQFNLDQNTALPLALLLAGWAYFPIRQAIFEYFIGPRNIKIADHVPTLIDSFSGVEDLEEYDGRLISFLKKVFGAKEIGEVGTNQIEKARLEDNGLTLRVPNVSDTASLQLIGKSGGRMLFSPNDAQVADSFVHLVRNMGDASAREFDKITQERARIVRDLHDDVGGRLLSLIYNAADEESAKDAREALDALKESLIVVEDSQTIDFSVAWHAMQQAAQVRLAQAGFTLRNIEQFESERILSAREYINFKRIVQEIVSNTIKYGRKGEMEMAMSVSEEGALKLKARNKIGRKKSDPTSTGRGIANIENRIQELGGSMSAGLSDDNFYQINVELPLID